MSGTIRTTAIVILALSTLLSNAELETSINVTEQVGAKSMVNLKLKNTFDEPIRSARASVFLLNDKGKVVAQSVKWIIDGTKDKKGLKPDETLDYTFVLKNEKAFTSAKVDITRIVLESGKVITPAIERLTPPVRAAPGDSTNRLKQKRDD